MVQIHQTTLLILLWFSAIAAADTNEGQNKVRRRHRLIYGVPSDEDVEDSKTRFDSTPFGDIGGDWNRILDSTDMSMDCMPINRNRNSKKSKKSKKSKSTKTDATKRYTGDYRYVLTEYESRGYWDIYLTSHFLFDETVVEKVTTITAPEKEAKVAKRKRAKTRKVEARSSGGKGKVEAAAILTIPLEKGKVEAATILTIPLEKVKGKVEAATILTIPLEKGK
jgi:hypothetical protein